MKNTPKRIKTNTNDDNFQTDVTQDVIKQWRHDWRHIHYRTGQTHQSVSHITSKSPNSSVVYKHKHSSIEPQINITATFTPVNK